MGGLPMLWSGALLVAAAQISLPIRGVAPKPVEALVYGRYSFQHFTCRSRITALSSISDDAHPEMSFERDAVGGASVVPPRTKKHQARKKRRRKKKKTAAKTVLTEEDVAQHVASTYVTGRGGLYHTNNARRQRFEKQMSDSHKEQMSYLRKLDRHPSLVLNADYQPLSHLPLSLWSWQDTVKAVFSGKCTVVDVYPNVLIRAVNLDMPLPSVIAMNQFSPQPNQRPAFTRRNVFLRDGYRCQYCKGLFRTGDLSLDHVVPRCRGGKLEWENAVTSCRKCNGRKGSLPLRDIHTVGMKLAREPRCPTKFELATQAGKMLPRRVHPTWAPYLGMDLKPQTDVRINLVANGGKEMEAIFDDV